jgi:hypothetical protein
VHQIDWSNGISSHIVFLGIPDRMEAVYELTFEVILIRFLALEGRKERDGLVVYIQTKKIELTVENLGFQLLKRADGVG